MYLVDLKVCKKKKKKISEICYCSQHNYYHVKICKKKKKNDGRRKKAIFSPCNHVLETDTAEKENYKKTFCYLQNCYLAFCSNQTILEIKGVGV